jgi:serine protein kinase
MAKYDGDWTKIIQNVRVERIVLSEQDRIGIGTFQPKDEKNQDSTELTGDINYRKIAEYGSDSDPRAFNFDGEFNVANRGLVEFIEVLKLDVAFLYDLLGASQEHKIKPKKFAQTHIDEVIIGHTNEPEYRKLQNNEFMEALRDRTVKIDIPYVTRPRRRDAHLPEGLQQQGGARQTHRAAHPARRVDVVGADPARGAQEGEDDRCSRSSSCTTARCCRDTPRIPIKELRAESPREGLRGISPRYVQDKISNALVTETGEGCINPFMVMNELGERPAAPLVDHQRGGSQALPRAARGRQGGVRGPRQVRSPARHLGRRGIDPALVRQLHRQRQGVHAEGKSP